MRNKVKVVAVIVPQNLNGRAAALGKIHGSPLAHAFAGNGGAIAIFGVKRGKISHAAQIGVDISSTILLIFVKILRPET